MDLTARIPSWWEEKQPILNAAPVPDSGIEVLPEVAVNARIVWADEGPQTIRTVAYALADWRILVLVSDPRSDTHGVWLSRDEVTPASHAPVPRGQPPAMQAADTECAPRSD